MIAPERDMPWTQWTSTPHCLDSLPSFADGVDCSPDWIQSHASFKWQRRSSRGSSSMLICFNISWFEPVADSLLPSSEVVYFGASSGRMTERT
jgi:hypothetical protein